jgi:hypothetical protein
MLLRNRGANFMKNVKNMGIKLAAVLMLCACNVWAQVPDGLGPTSAAPAVSPAAAEVVKLAASGVGDEVVLAYIRNSQSIFDLNADQVLYLKDVGLSPQVITAMLDHDSVLKSQAQPAPAVAQPYAPTPQPAEAPAPAPAPVAAAAPAPTYVSSPPLEASYFYNDLAPYGTWVDLSGVGWCWQPSAVVVTAGWRPYCNGGHWVWTDAGWFWQSDYSWGWAPFHYGRWYLDGRCGWVWTPGTVWGPAWVTWRSVGTTCGWAPLPPHADFVAGVGWRYNGVSVGVGFDFGLSANAFAFVTFGNLCANNVSYHCLPPSQATVIYKQTTVINNYIVNNNTFINRGIAYDRIAAASHTPVPRASVRDFPAGRGPASGGVFVYRTPLHEPPKSVRMVAQKVDVGHTIRHTSLSETRHDAVNATRYDTRSAAGGGKATSYFQPNQNPATPAKGQPNSTFGSGKAAPASTTPSSGQNPVGTPNTKTTQWSTTDKAATGKTGSTLQNAPTRKAFEPYQSPSGNGSKQAVESATSGSSRGAAVRSSHLQEEAANTAGQSQEATTSGQTSARLTPSYRWYTPKMGDQAAEVRSLPKSSGQPTVTTPNVQPGSSRKNQ